MKAGIVVVAAELMLGTALGVLVPLRCLKAGFVVCPSVGNPLEGVRFDPFVLRLH